MGLQLSLTGVLRASGNLVITMMLALVSQWVLQFPIAYLLSKHTALGAHGLWWAFPISNVIIATITALIYAQGGWKEKRLIREEERLTEKVSEEILIEEGAHAT
jgi:Na+-driven multidrug efflux pump